MNDLAIDDMSRSMFTQFSDYVQYQSLIHHTPNYLRTVLSLVIVPY